MTGITQTFPCNKWLADDEGDKLIERRLKEDINLRETRPPGNHRRLHVCLIDPCLFSAIPWCVWVYTSDKKGAGTDARVTIVLYGREGKSDDIPLNSRSDTFEAGRCDEFKANATDVGIPYKLRVRHDNSGSFASWHLDRVRPNERISVARSEPR
jgi:lipoxygenase homology domain-containing protein 1